MTTYNSFTDSAINKATGSINSVTSSNAVDTAINNATALPTSQASNLMSMSSDINSSGNAASTAIPSIANANGVSTDNPVAKIYNDSNASLTNSAITSLGVISAPNSLATSTIAAATASPNVLATTTFNSGPNDKIASVDVYASPDSTTPINSIQAIVPAAASTALSAFKGSKSGLASLNNLLNSTASITSGLGNINPLAQIQKQVPAMFAGIKQLPPGCGDNLKKGLNKDLSKLNKFKGLLNGKSFNLNNKSLQCALGIGNAINAMAKANGCGNIPFSFPDVSALLSSLKNLLNSALSIGMPGVFSSLICGLTDLLSIDRLASMCAPNVASFSDLGSLTSMANATTAGSLMCTNPDLISNFASNYSSSSPGLLGTNTISNYTDMTSSFSTINPNWLSTTTAANGDITDLSNVCTASDDFNQTASDGIDFGAQKTTYPNIGKFPDSTNALANDAVPNQDLLLNPTLANSGTDVNSCIARDYPYTVVSGSLASSTKGVYIPNYDVIDPVVLAA